MTFDLRQPYESTERPNGASGVEHDDT